jgi:hypothetical protein
MLSAAIGNNVRSISPAIGGGSDSAAAYPRSLVSECKNRNASSDLHSLQDESQLCTSADNCPLPPLPRRVGIGHIVTPTTLGIPLHANRRGASPLVVSRSGSRRSTGCGSGGTSSSHLAAAAGVYDAEQEEAHEEERVQRDATLAFLLSSCNSSNNSFTHRDEARRSVQGGGSGNRQQLRLVIEAAAAAATAAAAAAAAAYYPSVHSPTMESSFADSLLGGSRSILGISPPRAAPRPHRT